MICLNAPDSAKSNSTMKFYRFNRLCFALILPALLLEFSAAAQSFVFSNAAPRAIPRRASIILIVADGLGYGDLSCNGQTNFQTPNLDKLAAEGVRFTNYHAGAAAESPACAALMLGKDSAHLRQRADADVPLGPDDVTVAQILKNSGYHTGVIGEWNLGDEKSAGAPWKKGFDEFAGYLDANDAANFYADYVWRYAPNSIRNRTNYLMNTFMGREKLLANFGDAKGQYIPDLLTKAALNFVQINRSDRANHYRPFFLVVNYRIPGDGKSAVPTDAPFSEEPWPQAARNKAAMIARLDGYIGQLQEQLEKLGITNNTAIFFTSATAPQQTGAADKDFFHSAAADGNLRVPMIVKCPALLPAGMVSGRNWSAADFLPTAADIAYAKPPQGVNGVSVLPKVLKKGIKR